MSWSFAPAPATMVLLRPAAPSARVRQAAALVLDGYWDRTLPVMPEVIAKELRIDLVVRGGEGDDWAYSGYFVSSAGSKRIEFNMRDSLTRQRFTIAHELGHFALGHGTSPRDSADNFGTGVRDHKEREANQFAAELLMPEPAVVEMINSGYTSVEQLAKLFRVSKIAMGYRLTNLNLNP